MKKLILLLAVFGFGAAQAKTPSAVTVTAKVLSVECEKANEPGIKEFCKTKFQIKKCKTDSSLEGQVVSVSHVRGGIGPEYSGAGATNIDVKAPGKL